MDQNYETKHHREEEGHCWYRARRDILIALVEKYPKNSKILDIGCSGGPLISDLNKIGFNDIYGIDISEDAIKICKDRGLKKISLERGESLNFKNEEFDVIIASDILEHIKEEGVALQEWKRILKINGKLIVFVPAFNFLWSSHDEKNYHYRRYSKTTLKKSLQNAGFSIERSSYWNLSLFLPTLLMRMVQKAIKSLFGKKQKNDQLHSLNPIFDSLIFKLLKLENLILKKIDLPLGVSTFCISKKSF